MLGTVCKQHIRNIFREKCHWNTGTLHGQNPTTEKDCFPSNARRSVFGVRIWIT